MNGKELKECKKRAKTGDVEAQVALGDWYRVHKPKNAAKILLWYEKAAAQGYEDAKEEVKKLKNRKK